MSSTIGWINTLLDEQDEVRALKEELKAKEDRITALETKLAQLRVCFHVMEQHIPESITVTKTVRYL